MRWLNPLKQVGTFLAHIYSPIDLSFLTAKNAFPTTFFLWAHYSFFLFVCVTLNNASGGVSDATQ